MARRKKVVVTPPLPEDACPLDGEPWSDHDPDTKMRHVVEAKEQSKKTYNPKRML